MPYFTVLPTSPILLADIDLQETRQTEELRADIETILGSRPSWALPIGEVPPLLGLGGYGIDRGIDIRTGELLSGQDWVNAVDDLSIAEREVCETAHPSIAVAYLHAWNAGAMLGPIGSSEDLVVPLGLSAASRANSPLAPVDGAAEFDEDVIRALLDGDELGLSSLAARAHAVHADLDLLDAALSVFARSSRQPGHDDSGSDAPAFAYSRPVFDGYVHEVRTICGSGTYR